MLLDHAAPPFSAFRGIVGLLTRRISVECFFWGPVSDLLNRVLMNPRSDDHNSILLHPSENQKSAHDHLLVVSDTLGRLRVSPAFGNVQYVHIIILYPYDGTSRTGLQPRSALVVYRRHSHLSFLHTFSLFFFIYRLGFIIRIWTFFLASLKWWISVAHHGSLQYLPNLPRFSLCFS